MNFIQVFNKQSRYIAASLCGLILLEIFTPTVAVALTAGPTSPETTSFEPVDTTDMVNPLMGSFTYNLPLLEVPGPEGGYPLSLSYHAGIRPDVEASWVGLGWTLNPGAINRNVAGLPDDFSEVNIKQREYWIGGRREEYGLEVGFASVVNVGLVFSDDTYQGFGIGGNVGVGYQFGTFSAGVDVGISPYGDAYASIGISMPIKIMPGLNGSATLGFSTNFESVGFGISGGLVGSKNHSLLGASMSTQSSKPSLSAMGIRSNSVTQKTAKISTSGYGFGFSIPIFGIITIGVSLKDTRYWIDQTSEAESSGTLYSPIFSSTGSGSSSIEKAYDNYRLRPEGVHILRKLSDVEMVGGAYPEYDQYTVLGQGIGGQIRPFLFQRTLAMQSSNHNDNNRFGVDNSAQKAGVGFRFLNEFSGSYDQELQNISDEVYSPRSTIKLPFTNAGTSDPRVGNELAASKNVQYFTNDQIRTGVAKSKGFIDVGSTAKGFNRLANGSSVGSNGTATKGGSQIGGFMITNESGVTYHYALPSYTYDEYSYSYTNEGGHRDIQMIKKEPYAYTWMLTAVTGADFVDRNENGLLDEGDWGYWVAMDYGKWTNRYIWRTPALGNDTDLKQNYRMYTRGQKELYYLNRIRTRTHTAIFEKEVRLDGKGSGQGALALKGFGNQGAFDSSSGQTLRLNKIYLMKNSEAALISETSANVANGRSSDFYHNVIDSDDVVAIGRASFEAKSIRVIDFGYSYSLSRHTANSFNIRQPNVKLGKLTLDGIQFRGKGGEAVLPTTKFSYDFSNETFKANLYENGLLLTNEVELEAGTMLETVGQNPKYLGMITKNEGGGFYKLSNGENFNPAVNADVRITKNPNYDRDHHDIWGYYKGDLNNSILPLSEDFARRVTSASAKGTDAWSLRKISMPTGGEIKLDYESHDFKTAVYDKKLSIPITKFTRVDDYTVIAEVPTEKEEFEKVYQPSSVIDAVFFQNAGPLFIPLGHIISNSSSPKCTYVEWVGLSNIKLHFTEKITTLRVGNIRLNLNSDKNLGGGIRIRKISTTSADNTVYETEYICQKNGESSGVTSYVPYNMETGYVPDFNFKEFADVMFTNIINTDLDDVLKYAREIPGPGIMYSNVRIKSKVIHSNGDMRSEGYVENVYRVFDRWMVKRHVLQKFSSGPASLASNSTYGTNTTITDFTTNIGDLISLRYFDANGILIKDIQNKYIVDNISLDGDVKKSYRTQLSNFANQGLLVERFGEVRRTSYVENMTSYDKTFIGMAAREHYPSIMLSSTVNDHVNGGAQTTSNLAFDFLNGQPRSVLTTDSYGNRFLSETNFAYHQYPEMGSKLVNFNNKNMLTQVFSNVNYKVNASNVKEGVISGSKTLWSKNVDVLTPTGTIIKQNSDTYGSVWRPEQSQIIEIPNTYGSTGILPISQYNGAASFWKTISTFSLYNVFSKGLEDYDLNGNYSANRYGYNNSKIVATADYSKYKELAYSGAEDEVLNAQISGEVSKGSGTVSLAAAHTGMRSLSVPSKSKGFEYQVAIASLTPGRVYSASVWVKNTPNSQVTLKYDIDDAKTSAPANSVQSTKKAGDWTLVTLEIPINGGTSLKVYAENEGTASAFMDDFRFQPKNTGAKAFVYDAVSGELNYILDHLNLFTRFEYDVTGRLIATYKEQFGRAPYKTNEYAMHYKTDKNTYYNDMLEENVQRNNCATPGVGLYAIYNVPAGKYTSQISKADANSKAMAEMNTKGQQYANANAGCVVCNSYKVTINRSNIQNTNLYVNYTDCFHRYQSIYYRSISEHPTSTASQLVFYVCVSNSDPTVRFSIGYNQPSINVNAQIEYVGSCSVN